MELTPEQRVGLQEQIESDKAEVERLVHRVAEFTLEIARLEDHISYCKKKLTE